VRLTPVLASNRSTPCWRHVGGGTRTVPELWVKDLLEAGS
jgi:hypothetical protein